MKKNNFYYLILLCVFFACVNKTTKNWSPLHPALKEVIEQGPYKPTWPSLDTHKVPKWFKNDKIGFSAHWGIYSVVGWTPRKDSPYGVAYAEWYWQHMGNKAIAKYHKKHYGDAFYDDFIDGTKNLVSGKIDKFDAAKFNAEDWAKKFKAAGAKYFFITSKHHDGFCLWDTKLTNRNAKKMGPKRDLLMEIKNACKKYDLKFGFYYSLYEWENPIYDKSWFAWKHHQKKNPNYKGFKELKDADADGKIEYVDDYTVLQLKELIDNYDPDLIYLDGEWDTFSDYWKSKQIAAYYYNKALERNKEVVLNDRYGKETRGQKGDLFHVEYNANVDKSKAWAMWRGFGNSFGYNRNEHKDNILSIKNTLKMMVRVIATNGNIEFNLTPKANGTFPDFEIERLKAMGDFATINGEAIYGTEPVKSKIKAKDYAYITQKPEEKTLYIHVYDWKENKAIISNFEYKIKELKLIVGTKKYQNIKYNLDEKEKNLTIFKPQKFNNPHMNVVKITYEK